MTDSHYIKQSVRDENFSKRVDDAGRLYKSHAVADDIAREQGVYGQWPMRYRTREARNE